MRTSFRGMAVLLVLSVATVPAILLSSFAIDRFSQQVEMRSLNELQLKAENSSRHIAFELTRISDRLAAMAADSDVRRGVKSAFYLEKTDGRLTELLRANPVVRGAFLFDSEGMMVSGIPEIFMADTFTSKLRQMSSPIVPGRSFSELRSIAQLDTVDDTPSVFIAVPVEGMVNIASGYLLAMVPVNRLISLITVQDEELVEIESRKKLDTTSAQHSLPKASGKDFLTATAEIPFAFSQSEQLVILYGAPRAKLLQPVSDTAWRLSIYAGVLILLIGVLAFVLTRRLLKPLRRLEEQTESYARGDYEFQPSTFKFREMEEFSRLLADMARQVKDRQELQQAVFKTELDVLRNQMNPHFLFNTLNAISTYMSIDPAKATKMSEQLASLYRLILEATRHSTVPLDIECEIVRSYLNLETVRFGKRLTWQLNCQIDGSQFEIPGLILQTIAENAIKHGISKALSGGRIDIEIVADQDAGCKIEVVNTGAPFRVKEGDGIGVENTRRRLDILFGSYHQFAIKVREDGATSVSFRIPAKSHGLKTSITNTEAR